MFNIDFIWMLRIGFVLGVLKIVINLIDIKFSCLKIVFCFYRLLVILIGIIVFVLLRINILLGV